MKEITLLLPGLHADAMALHLLIVMKHYLSDKKAADINDKTMRLIETMNEVREKLQSLPEEAGYESPQEIRLSHLQAEAFLLAFTSREFLHPALADSYYQRNTFEYYHNGIYKHYIRQVWEGMEEE